MGEQMGFPATLEEFLTKFSFTDEKKVYTNGSELIPVFRVLQAVEHYFKYVSVKEVLLAYMRRDSDISEEYQAVIDTYENVFKAIRDTLPQSLIEKLTCSEVISLVLSYKHVIFQYGCYVGTPQLDTSISNVKSTPSPMHGNSLKFNINSSEDN